MYCEYCHGVSTHLANCPLYFPKDSRNCCSICEEGICDGEEYIENENGDMAHIECIHGIYDLLYWLGLNVKTMIEDDYED